MTVFERVAAARRQLHEAGLSPVESDLSARLLAEHVLDWSPERYFTSGNEPEPSEFTAAYDTLVARRASREPLPTSSASRSSGRCRSRCRRTCSFRGRRPS